VNIAFKGQFQSEHNEGRFGIGAAQTTQPPKTLQESCAFR
jgi:hypothetical protein